MRHYQNDVMLAERVAGRRPDVVRTGMCPSHRPTPAMGQAVTLTDSAFSELADSAMAEWASGLGVRIEDLRAQCSEGGCWWLRGGGCAEIWSQEQRRLRSYAVKGSPEWFCTRHIQSPD